MATLPPEQPSRGPDEEKIRRTSRWIMWGLVIGLALVVLVIGLCVAALNNSGGG